MLKLSLILLIIFMCNCIICRIYATIAQKKFKNRENISNNYVQDQNKQTYFRHIKEYIASLCFFTIRFIGIIPSFRLRKFLYKNVFLMKIGKGTKIRGFVEFSSPWNIEIGENSMIGQECKLDGRNGLYIGNNVNISDCTAIWTAQHNIQSPTFVGSGGEVVIYDRVWLCYRSIVLPGCTIGEGSVLASGAIATKDLEKFSLYAGMPAKKIKERNSNLIYNIDVKYMHGF